MLKVADSILPTPIHKLLRSGLLTHFAIFLVNDISPMINYSHIKMKCNRLKLHLMKWIYQLIAYELYCSIQCQNIHTNVDFLMSFSSEYEMKYFCALNIYMINLLIFKVWCI